MKMTPAIFETHEIRRIYDEKSETWFFGRGHRPISHPASW